MILERSLNFNNFWNDKFDDKKSNFSILKIFPSNYPFNSTWTFERLSSSTHNKIKSVIKNHFRVKFCGRFWLCVSFSFFLVFQIFLNKKKFSQNKFMRKILFLWQKLFCNFQNYFLKITNELRLLVLLRSVELKDQFGVAHNIKVQTLGTEDTWKTPSLLMVYKDNGAKIVFSQVRSKAENEFFNKPSTTRRFTWKLTRLCTKTTTRSIKSWWRTTACAMRSSAMCWARTWACRWTRRKKSATWSSLKDFFSDDMR